MASAPESPGIRVWPSGAARATCSAATTPPAPGRFSTTKGRPKASASLAASMRASTSGLPPGAAAAIRRTLLDGYASCACAQGAISSSTASTIFISASLVDEARRLHRRLEILGDRTARQQRHLRRNLKRLAHRGRHARALLAAHFDEEPQHVVVALVGDLRAEVHYVRIAEQRVLQVGVIDVHAAHLEEPDRASRVLEHREY